MRNLRTTGLVIFLGSFVLWLFTFWLEGYELTDEVLSEIFDETHLIEFQDVGKDILKKDYPTSFGLVSDLKLVFSHINESRLKDYSIQESQIDQMVKLVGTSPLQFDKIQTLFDSTHVIENYQFRTLRSWGSWLEAKSFSSEAEAKVAITGVVENIKRWGIINDLGYSTYTIDDLNYAIVKSSSAGPVSENPEMFLILIYVMGSLGALMYLIPVLRLDGPQGIKNNGIFNSVLTHRGWLGILLGTFLIFFYITLYFYPEYMTAWIIMVDPISEFLKGQEAGRFFLYGFIYTLAILVMAVRMTIKYRHSKYQIWRTISVTFFQLAFAFLIPEFLMRLNQPYFDFKNIWPLDYDFFFDYELDSMMQNGSIGLFMLGWGIGLIIIGVPIFVYFFGKRWYCSWVCGCGGLAETVGDPFRQLSDKSLKAWKIERYSVHFVLLFAVVMTVGVLYTYWTGQDSILGVNTYTVRSIYGSWIGAGFAGVVGTGFYPLMGNRVWCRFGCPLAAYLGLIQWFKSRFRITTNGGQCISCGNCSTYCEMGIDVRWYAQRGENIIRSSCVGCGVCSEVCPRGVLKLENRSDDNRFISSGLVGNASFPEIKKND